MLRIALVLAALYVSPILGAESRFDEYLWTKGTWSEFKLHKPRDRWRVEDAPLVYQQSQQLRLNRECDFISTDGPGGKQKVVLEQDEGNSDWVMALVDRVVAGATVFGSVCTSAVEGGWDAVLAGVYENEVPSVDRIKFLLEDVCVETVDSVIKKFTLKRETGKEGVGEWTLILRNGDEQRSYAEVEAVELACDRFMHQRRSEFIRALRIAAVEFDEVLKRVDAQQLEDARGHKGDLRMMENRCEDIHPKCEEWADKGECVINPTYMLNFCRVSCGVCEGENTFHKVGVYSLGPTSREELEKKSSELLAGLKEELCPATQTPFGLQASPIQEIKYNPILKANEITEISRALYIELKGKCLLLFRGWWTYEICFYTEVRQLHYDSDGDTVLTSKLIGTFSEQHTRHLRPLRLSDEEMDRLGLLGARRPYVMQSYDTGDTCNDGGLTRSAEIRLMCSEGLKQAPLAADSIGATIEEPDECRYVINVFLSLMCHYPEYGESPSEQKVV